MVLVGNRECNTKRGFKNQLYIELGLQYVTKSEKREILFHEEMRGQNDDDLGKLLNLLLLTNSKAPNNHYDKNKRTPSKY